MSLGRKRLQKLAERVCQGDQAAQIEFQRELESQLSHLVRRVIRKQAGTSPLGRRILEEAEKLKDPPRSRGKEVEETIPNIARRLAKSITRRLQSDPECFLLLNDKDIAGD